MRLSLAVLVLIALPMPLWGQDRPVVLAPVSGLAVYAADSVSGGAVVRPTLGADLSASLTERWIVGSRYQTLAPGGGVGRVHSIALAVRRQVGGHAGGTAALIGGGAHLTDTFRGDRAVGGGPYVDLSARFPLGDRIELGVQGAAALRLGDGRAGVLASGGLVLGVRLGERRCAIPEVQRLAAPERLLPYERGVFQVEAARGSNVVWTFEDRGSVPGASVERVFVQADTVAWKVVVTGCAGSAVVEGTVIVESPCWESPRIQTLAVAEIEPGAPFAQARVLATGTPPLRYVWRWRGGRVDTTESVRVPVGGPGAYPVRVTVSNCTDLTDSASSTLFIPARAADDRDLPTARPSPVHVGFGFDSCRFLAPKAVLNAQALRATDQRVSPDFEEALPDSLLRPFIKVMQDHTTRALVVRGYADFVPAAQDPAYNLALSAARAETVAAYIRARLPTLASPDASLPDLQGRILALGYGRADRPVCAEDERDPGCLQQRTAMLSVEGPLTSNDVRRLLQPIRFDLLPVLRGCTLPR